MNTKPGKNGEKGKQNEKRGTNDLYIGSDDPIALSPPNCLEKTHSTADQLYERKTPLN